MVSRLQKRARYGSMYQPVRTNGDLLHVPQPVGPVPWSYDVSGTGGNGVFWIGQSHEDGLSPIGPNGPGPVSTGVPSVERATSLIVGPLTSVLPWRVYRGGWAPSVGRVSPGDTEPQPLPTWLRDPTLTNRTPGISVDQQWFLPPGWKKPAARFWAETIRHALWFGRGWFMFQEGTDLAPLAGTFLNVAPNVVNITEDGSCEISLGDAGTVTADRAGRFDWAGFTWRLACVSEPLGDGLGVIGRHAADLNIGVQVSRYTSNTFRAGIPNGYLKVTQPGFTKDQADTLKAAWMAAHGSTRGIAILNATTDFQPINFSPVDAALVEVDHMMTRKVAHCFNLSGWALDAGSAGNDYANITMRRQDKADDTIVPWKRAVEDALSPLLAYGTWLELETRGYLQTDPAARMAYYKSGMDLGAFTTGVRPRPGADPDAVPPPGDRRAPSVANWRHSRTPARPARPARGRQH